MDLRPFHPLAARRRDLLTRDELLARLPAGTIDGAVADARLHLVFDGVYSLGVHRDRADLWVAAVLACGRGAVLSHGSAAALWGFGRERGHLLEVSAARSRTGPEGVLVHRPRHAAPWVEHRGVVVTPVLRTLVDLADVVSFDALLTMAMEADHRRLADLRRLEPISGRRGHGRVLRLVEYTEEGTRSELEALAREVLGDAGLPAYEANGWVHRRRLDCVWREHRVALECDSYGFHRERRKFESDRRAPLELERRGWRVLRVTWRQLRHEPWLVVEAVATALAERGWAGTTSP